MLTVNFWKFHKDWRFLFTYIMMLTLLQTQLPKSKMNMGLRSDRPGPGVCKQQRESDARSPCMGSARLAKPGAWITLTSCTGHFRAMVSIPGIRWHWRPTLTMWLTHSGQDPTLASPRQDGLATGPAHHLLRPQAQHTSGGGTPYLKNVQHVFVAEQGHRDADLLILCLVASWGDLGVQRRQICWLTKAHPGWHRQPTPPDDMAHKAS